MELVQYIIPSGVQDFVEEDSKIKKVAFDLN